MNLFLSDVTGLMKFPDSKWILKNPSEREEVRGLCLFKQEEEGRERTGEEVKGRQRGEE